MTKADQLSHSHLNLLHVLFFRRSLVDHAGRLGDKAETVQTGTSFDLMGQLSYQVQILRTQGVGDRHYPLRQFLGKAADKPGDGRRVQRTAVQQAKRSLWCSRPGCQSRRNARRAQVPPENRPQLRRIDRFGKVVVAARFQAMLAIAHHGMRREGHDGAAPAIVAEPSRGLVAVHSRHLDVHQDQVVGASFRLRLLGHVACHTAVLGDFHLQVEPAKNLTKHELDGGHVFHQEHAALQCRLLLPGRRCNLDGHRRFE